VKKNNNGTIMVFVVVVIGIIGLLYSTIFLLIEMENKINNSFEDKTKAYYIAESGLERGKIRLTHGDTSSFLMNNPFSSYYKDPHEVDVTILEIEPDVFKITSSASYNKTKKIMEGQILKLGTVYTVQSWKEIN
jgi:hypothetical protein